MVQDKSNTFVDNIISQLDMGISIIPLLGSGFSASAGIPTIGILENYFARCVYDSVSSIGFSAPSEERAWNPRSDNWPVFNDVLNQKDKAYWTKKIFNNFNTISNKAVDKNTLGIVQEAIGAMAEWRSSLLFLSRISNEQQNEFKLYSPDYSVHDNFFSHVVSGRKPSMEHYMLAAISIIFGIKTILTTNFDELIEKAFRQLNISLDIYNVHRRAELPPFRSLSKHRSLIKLHGSRYGLRASYSLDSLASIEDQINIASYFTDRQITQAEWIDESKKFTATKNLLIAGVSGEEARTRSLIKAIINRTEKLKVFWACYSNQDVERIEKEFASQLNSGSDIEVVRYPYLGLLLLELYQRRTGTIPSAQLQFPSVAQLPIPPSEIEVLDDETITEIPTQCTVNEGLAQDFKETFANCLKEKRNKFIVVYSQSEDEKKSLYGVSSLCTVSFNALQDEGKYCIWIDLFDIYTVDDLFERLKEAVASKSGTDNWMPVKVEEKPEEQLEEFKRFVEELGKNWYIFLYARNGVGTNIQLNEDDLFRKNIHRNGWLENEDDINEFGTLFAELSGKDCPSANFILVCYDGTIINILEKVYSFQRISIPKRVIKHEMNITTLVDNSINKWCDNNEDKRLFLYSLTLFRRWRYPASLFTWAIHGGRIYPNEDIDERRIKDTQTWLKGLSDILRIGAGGFIWVHNELRIKIKNKMEKDHPEILKEKPTLHQCIADWYCQLYLSSKDPLAILESVYHRIFCIKSLLKTHPAGHHRIDTSIVGAVSALDFSRVSFLSRGHSKSICSYLDKVKNVLVSNLEKDISDDNKKIKSKLLELKQACVRTQYNLAREVTEYPKALERLEEYQDISEELTLMSDGTQGDKYAQVKLLHQRVLLCTGYRAYGESEKALSEIFSKLKIKFPDVSDKVIGQEITDEKNDFKEIASEWASGKSNEELQITVKAMSRYMQLLIAQGHISYLCEHRGIGGHDCEKNNNKIYFTKARLVYHAALEIMRFIPDDSSGYIQHQQNILLSHLSLSVSSLQHHEEALRRLKEAHKFNQNNPAKQSDLSETIIDLHRLYVILHKIGSSDSDFPGFRKFRKLIYLEDYAGASEIRFDKTTISKMEFWLQKSRDILKHVEENLKKHRKNAWWIIWYFQLHMRTCELEVFANLASNTQLSYFDISYARENTDTVPDMILRDTTRMIRLDALRFALIIESYGHCLSAIDYFLEFREKNSVLEKRLDKCRNLRRKSVGALKTVLKNRTTKSNNEYYEKLSPMVESYIKYVIRCVPNKDQKSTEQ